MVQELNVQLTEARTCLEEQEEREKAKVWYASGDEGEGTGTDVAFATFANDCGSLGLKHHCL